MSASFHWFEADVKGTVWIRELDSPGSIFGANKCAEDGSPGVDLAETAASEKLLAGEPAGVV
jgi:hypothetical protein